VRARCLGFWRVEWKLPARELGRSFHAYLMAVRRISRLSPLTGRSPFSLFAVCAREGNKAAPCRRSGGNLRWEPKTKDRISLSLGDGSERDRRQRAHCRLRIRPLFVVCRVKGIRVSSTGGGWCRKVLDRNAITGTLALGGLWCKPGHDKKEDKRGRKKQKRECCTTQA